MNIIFIFTAALIVRLVSLVISKRNEKRLKAAGAIEYGKINSAVLTAAHILFYGLALYEAIHNDRQINEITFWGLALFIFSMTMLFLVISQLGDLWTIKLIIAKNHHVNKSALFKYIRHPNYFLNVIPELIAIALICQSWNVLMVCFPVYMIPLAIRIYQEETVMKEYVKGF